MSFQGQVMGPSLRPNFHPFLTSSSSSAAPAPPCADLTATCTWHGMAWHVHMSSMGRQDLNTPDPIHGLLLTLRCAFLGSGRLKADAIPGRDDSKITRMGINLINYMHLLT